MRRLVLLLVFGATLVVCGCEKQIYRGAHDPSWDEPAMSLGLDKDDVQRAVKVAAIAPEAKQAARDAGIDDNRTALLAVAKEATPEAQVAKVSGMIKKSLVS